MLFFRKMNVDLEKGKEIELKESITINIVCTNVLMCVNRNVDSIAIFDQKNIENENSNERNHGDQLPYTLFASLVKSGHHLHHSMEVFFMQNYLKFRKFVFRLSIDVEISNLLSKEISHRIVMF